MSKNFVSASIVAAGLVVWMGSGAFTHDTQATPLPDATDAESLRDSGADAAPSRVRIAVNNAEPRTRTVVLRGRTEAKRAVEVTAEIAGQVVSRPVERGMQVSKGQLLCEIAVDDREVAVEEARAGFEQARIEHEGSLKLAKQELLSEVAIATSEARQEEARAHLHRQMLNLERTRITAPFDGVVENLHLNAGDYAMPGASCATLIDLDPMLVVARVTEQEVENLQPGSMVAGSTRMGRDIDGQLSFIGKQNDPVTRTFPVEITVANSDYSLRSGLTVTLWADLDQVPAHRIAPSLLTLGDAGDMGVRTLDDTNRVVFTAVEIVEDGPEGLWVTGLPDTVNLITVGQEYVTVGELVEPVYMDTAKGQIAVR
ncbi:MAG: efflux RND transporter periplasmic adaptor subunit [Halieaceae bacterium]|nr:efflux RND transporter periplasmic adaptor subunit [Halieaceae bacterium]